MSKLNHFQVQFKEVKVTETGSIKIKGYASTPDIDRYDDIIQPEAFASAMKTFMANPVVLLGHDTDKPIGLVTEYNLDANGLEVTCEITNNTDECIEKIQNKTLRGFSIGWRCIDCIYKEENNKYIREVTNLDLAEISVVAVPANPSTLFTLAKSLKSFFDKKDAEETPTDVPAKEETPVEVAPEAVETPVEVETPTEETKDAPVEETPTEVTPTEETQTDPKTIEAETTQAETPETEETPVVVEEEKGEDVKPVEEAEPVAEGATEEEVKALVDQIVSDSVREATAPLIEEIKTLRDALTELNEKHSELEKDVLKIEVKSSHSRSTESKTLTYGDLFRS